MKQSLPVDADEDREAPVPGTARKRSRPLRDAIVALVVMLLVLGLVAGVSMYVVPLWRLHSALGKSGSDRRTAMERLGGPELQMVLLERYFRLPKSLAGRKREAARHMIEKLYELEFDTKSEPDLRWIRMALRALDCADPGARKDIQEFLLLNWLSVESKSGAEATTEVVSALAETLARDRSGNDVLVLQVLTSKGYWKACLSALGRRLENTDASVRSEAVKLLRLLSLLKRESIPEVAKVMSTALKGTDVSVRERAASWFLGPGRRESPDPSVVPLLAKTCLEGREGEERAAMILDRMKIPSARKALLEFCRLTIASENAVARRRAAVRLVALGQVGLETREAAMAALRGARDDPSPPVRRMVARSIRTLEACSRPGRGKWRRPAKPTNAKETRKLLDTTVSLEFTEQPLGEALSYLQGLGAPLQIDGRIRRDPRMVRPITFSVTDVEMHFALEWLLRLGGLEYRLEKDCVRVTRISKFPPAPPYFGRENPPRLGALSAERTKVLSEDLELKGIRAEFVDAPLSECVYFLEDNVDAPLILPRSSAGIAPGNPVTIKLTDVSVSQALKWMTAIAGASWRTEHGAIVIVPPPKKKAEAPSTGK